MFEKYTEKARRVIFFARYEVSEFGSKAIEPEHLLLGLLREDEATLARFLPAGASAEMIRGQVVCGLAKGDRISTSVEIPLSPLAKEVLEYAREESEGLGHRQIGTEHLLLGLLREGPEAGRVLRESGLELAGLRRRIKGDAQKG
jgi:ATP-dependent Clp protease ATP-binding subunit ClpC